MLYKAKIFFLATSIIILCISFHLIKDFSWITSHPNPYNINIKPITPNDHILLGHKININKASARDLDILPGIGPKLAFRIIQKRDQIDSFLSQKDLLKVSGIGPAKLSKIRQFIDVY